MDMDTAIHKLSGEHCRTTTTCGPRDFAEATSTPSSPRPRDSTVMIPQRQARINTDCT